jgi:hypothetical protein
MLVITLLGLDLIGEPFLEEGGEFVVEVVWGVLAFTPLIVILCEDAALDNVPEFASKTLFALQNGQLCCLLFCITIKHLMQNTCPQDNFTGRHSISQHIGQL